MRPKDAYTWLGIMFRKNQIKPMVVSLYSIFELNTMGIPSYFSYIIKNHSNIIRNIRQCDHFQHLFMDCNSIIYDSYYQLAKDNTKVSERAIIQRVIQHIKQLIGMIQPNGVIYIAFDGVAPFAKMSQQRTRRYKSLFTSNLENKPTVWNTANITPGTLFMKSLCDILHKEFANKERVYRVEKMIFSGSNVPGEGEHKLFE